ncbi:hypothetical protein DL96DRAFT_1459838 [Flagelloscypha sp. PMI_526]|nr:hypothetical protein DL96DRAFT_1459838 [Flagelloscypha sp. PMI_526]
MIKGEYLVTLPLTPPLTPVVPSSVSPDLRDFSSPAAFGAPGFGSLDPNFLTSPLFDDYDPTSPLFGDYTPNMDYQSTPLFGDTSDFFTSPLLVDNPNATDNGMNFNDIPLFSSDGRPNLQALPPATPALVNDSSPLMADISSPQLATPHSAVGSFDPAHVASAPSLFEDFAASVASSSSRATKPLPAPQRRAPTGTRRNITPASLIPDDAPTQTRKYTSPSTTSRKELPVTFARKRAAISMVDEDEVLPDLPPNATEREQIEWKRRQNTIAARKSRKRKLEHQQYLETELDRLKRDRDVWKVRAITLRGVLRGKGGDTALAMEEWDQEEE